MQNHILDLLKRHIGGSIRPSGTGHVTMRCPFHKGGEERKPSFTVSLEKGLYFCFTCHEAGNISYLLKKLGASTNEIDSELAIIQPQMERQKASWKLKQNNQFSNKDPFRADYILPESIFGMYDYCPTLLVEKGFDAALLKYMDIGYDRVANRIMYPIRDIYGNLAGFSGGVTPLSSSQIPKYKVYEGAKAVANGTYIPSDYGTWFDSNFPGYHVENHLYLWGIDKIYTKMSSTADASTLLFLVEGFKACLWMKQCGFENTVALSGSYISTRQQQILHRLDCTIVLFLDNDVAGKKATTHIGQTLWKPMYSRVLVVGYPKEDCNTQPDDYSVDEIQNMVANKKPYYEYIANRGK